MNNEDTNDPIVRQRCCDGCGLPPFSTTIDDSDAATAAGGGVIQMKLLPLRRCSKCQKAWYHNAACQKRHYPKHKKVCCQQQQPQKQQQNRDGSNQQNDTDTASGNAKGTGIAVSKEKANHQQAEKRKETLFSIQDRPGRGKCMIASQKIPSGCPMSSCSSITAAAAAAASIDNGVDGGDNGNDFFPAIVPPVLAECERPNRCVVCFARCCRATPKPSASRGSSSSRVVLCNDSRFPVLACTPECYQAHQSWLDAEVATVKSCLSSSSSSDNSSSRERGVFSPPPMFLPMILPTALLVYRICVALIHESMTWKEIQCMASHIFSNDDNVDGAQAAHQQAVFVTVASLLTTNINTIWKHDAHKQQAAQRVASQYVSEILARVKVNAFSICTSDSDISLDDDAVGVGIFRTSHYMNHSCDPNARQTFRLGNNNSIVGQLPQLCIHARRDIPAGEEITISYINHDEEPSRTRRRQELMRSYHFHCTCPRCGNG